MSAQESLSLSHGFESPHATFSHPGRLVRLLSAIVLILFVAVDRFRNQFTMCNTVAS